MENNLDKITREFQERKGELVIDGDSVTRLIGIADDGEDYYYVYFNGKRVRLVSCLIKYIPLKGKIDAEDYEGMVRIVHLNHPDFSEDHSEVSVSEYRNSLIEGVPFISGPYWEIN
jgi:hypothetical protein